MFIFVSYSNEQSISDQRKEIKSMVVNMLQNFIYMYYIHNGNIKCIVSTIKCVSFEPIHYNINMDVVSSFMIFSNFDICFY